MAVQSFTHGSDEQTIQDIASCIVGAVSPEAVVLFGSRASHAARPNSDVDILVVMPDDKAFDWWSVYRAIYAALRSVPAAVDILLYTRSQVEERRNDAFDVVGIALREGRCLHGRNA